MTMATATNDRFGAVLVLITLASCAFFLAQGATALISSKLLSPGADDAPTRSTAAAVPPLASRRHDPAVILRRNIFDSTLGDLTDAPLPEASLPDEDLPQQDVETPCKGTMR